MTIAATLGKEGFSVDLFEEKRDVFMSASGINQFRLHKGYHYPRSIETIFKSKEELLTKEVKGFLGCVR